MSVWHMPIRLRFGGMATRSPPQGTHNTHPHIVCLGNGMLDVDARGRCSTPGTEFDVDDDLA